MASPARLRAQPFGSPSTTLRDWAHLVEEADHLTERWQRGDAAQVLESIAGPLAEAERAGVMDVANRLRYVAALSELDLGHLEHTVDACDQILAATADQGDPAWTSSALALRSRARRGLGDELAALDDLVESAVLADDLRASGYSSLHAMTSLAAGCTALRLYELAVDSYQRAGQLLARPELNQARVAQLVDLMLVEVLWGLELDRVGQHDDARSHLGAAIALAAQAEPLPAGDDGGAWSARIEARVGLCRAVLGESRAALDDLAGVLDRLGPARPVDVAVARLGLARAYGALEPAGRAGSATADAADAAAATGDQALVLAAAWERARLAEHAHRAGGWSSGPAGIVAEYVQLLEQERADQRLAFTRETSDRIQAELDRRAASRMSSAYLTDSLTGVANRRHFELRLPEMVRRAAEHDETLALAFVDLDATTTVDDLTATGTALRDRLAPDGFVARYGGCEFAALMPRSTTKQLAGVVADVLGEAHVDGPARPRVGIASVRRPPSVAGLVAAADEALMAARRGGGGIQLAVR